MPSFGLSEQDVGAPFPLSSTGTFRVSWDLVNYREDKTNTRKLYHPTEQADIAEDKSPFVHVALATGSLDMLEKWYSGDLEEIWKGIIVKSSSSVTRRDCILSTKFESLLSERRELIRQKTLTECVSGLLASFKEDHEKILSRIASIRASRRVTEAPEPNLDIKDTKPQAFMNPGPSNNFEVSEKSELETPTAVKRYKEISNLARPMLDAFHRLEQASDPTLKKAKLQMRMNINKRIIQIANSRAHIKSIVNELTFIINEAWNQHGADFMNYCIVITAKKIVEQAETQISLHSPSAFPVAQVVVDLSCQQKGLMPVIVYLIMKKCPYAVPRYISRRVDQSVREHKIKMGYTENGQSLEQEMMYTERMAGILCLYGAIIQSKPTSGAQSPYGIQNGWLWMASILNIRPEPITPYMICAFLDTAGYGMWLTFHKNFELLLRFLKEKYIGMIPPGSIAAKTRLELYIDKFFEKRSPSITVPEGSVLLP